MTRTETKLNYDVILETYMKRIRKDSIDALDHLTMIEVIGAIELLKTELTMNKFLDFITRENTD